MTIGFVGLGKMGMQMTTRLIRGGHKVVAMDVVPAAVAAAVALGATTASTREELLTEMSTAPVAVVWLMIPAQFVQAEVEAWAQILPPGSIIVDGGNSDWRETMKRAKLATSKNIEMIDVGTSGGVLGIELGFSMMVGGAPEAVTTLTPALVSLARPDGWGHFGPTGSGHYIKMIHNAIEYGMMEAYAEGFHLLKDGSIPNLDLAAIARVWQHGSIIASNLNGLAAEILQANPDFEGIDGYVAENGEARWTVEAAAVESIAMPVVEAALQVRADSQGGKVHYGTKFLAALRNAFGGHAVNKS